MARRDYRKAEKMRKGYVIAWDALISLTFVIVLTLGFIGIQYTQNTARGSSTIENLNSRSENAMDTLNKRGMLEEIGYFWAQGNLSYAANITQQNLDGLIPPNMGYRLEAIDGNNVSVIYDTGNSRPNSADAKDQTRSVRLISGYKTNASRSGWAARAMLIENDTWEINKIANKSACCQNWPDLLVQYASTTSTDAVFYVMVPGGADLDSAILNVSWVGKTMIASTGSSSVSSSGSSSASSSSEPQSMCNTCPATGACDIPGWYSAFGDSYNYHGLTIPPGQTCNEEITIYTGTAPTPTGTNEYDLFINLADSTAPSCLPTCDIRSGTCHCKCQRPWSRPDINPPWGWDHTTFFDVYTPTNYQYRKFDLFGLTEGTYQIMVDCWSPLGGGALCPGQYYIYATTLTGSTAGCPNSPISSLSTLSAPASSATGSVSSASSSASATATASASSSTATSASSSSPGPLGNSCAVNGDCSSGHCAADYDGAGKWCAPAGNCTHSTIASCGSTCYGYKTGEFAPDCNSTYAVWSCNTGTWTNVSCTACGDGLGFNLPCKGISACQAGTHATCTGACSTQNAVCDYCGSMTRGLSGSDTWYNAACNATGGCQSTGSTNCLVCKSCNITGYSGDCSIQGINYYLNAVNDTVDPNKCAAGQYCNGAGACTAAPMDLCDSAPRQIGFAGGVCSNPINCNDDASGDGKNVRLSNQDHATTSAYLGGWDSGNSQTAWQYTKTDDDDMSIGTSTYFAHHGTTFTVNVSVGNANSMSFQFYVMPQGDCYMNVTLANATGAAIGQCRVGSPSGSATCMPSGAGSMDMFKSRWWTCTIGGNTALTNGVIRKNAINTLTVGYNSPITGSSCGADYPCTMFFDTIGVSCG